MALNFLLKRSGTADKRPDPTSMALGELDLNYDAETGGVFYKDSDGDVVKVGSAQVSATAPNATPVGSAGNSTGEFWYDTANSELKMWDGTDWVATGGGSSPSPATPTVAGIVLGITNTTNTALGCNALLANTTGTNIVAIGLGAFAQSTGGTNSISIGCNAACFIKAPSNAIVIGAGAAPSAGTLTCTVVVGNGAVGTATAASSSVFVGAGAGGSGTSGSCSVAVGHQALAGFIPANTVAIGKSALCAMASGFPPPSGSVAIGFSAGSNQTAGSCNVIIGPSAQALSTTGSFQLTIGYSATCNWITGDSTKAIRPGAGIVDCAGSSGTVGQVLTSNGANAICWATVSGGGGVAGVTGTAPITVDNTDPANPVLGVDASSTTAAGVVQLNDTVTSTSTTEAATANAVKTAYDEAALAITDAATAQGTADFAQADATQALSDAAAAQATADAAIPCAALTAKGNLIVATTASTPTALPVGTDGQVLTACSACSTGVTWAAAGGGGGGDPATTCSRGVVLAYTCQCSNSNTALGNNALGGFGFSGSNNVGVGNLAGRCLTGGVGHTFVGNSAGRFSTAGCFNTFLGFEAGINPTTSCCNTAVGACALYSASCTAHNNVAIGALALRGTTLISGCGNVAVGFCSGVAMTSGAWNTLIGDRSGCGLTEGRGNIQIGGSRCDGFYDPAFSLSNQSNRISMGSSLVSNAYIQVAWTVVSDARDKTNITALPIGLDFVNQLNPVSFQFKEDRESDLAHGPVRYGFLAQDVLEIEGENPVLVDNEDPEHLRMVNDHLNAILVNAIKELSAKNDALEARIAQLEGA